jgi:excisionase family DNA binding protein
VEPLAVSVKEAAELLGVSPFTIRRRIRGGALKIAHIGRRVVVPVDSLRALLDQQPSSATDIPPEECPHGGTGKAE